MTTTQLRLGVRVLLCHVRRRHCLHHLITSPTLALSTPHSLTQHHSYTQPPTHEESCVVCWKCHRDLGEVSRGAKGREGRTEESGRWGVRFFCPCDEHVVLPPSKRHTYFEIMNCPMTYRIDTEALKHTFKQLQRQLHPDKFSNTSQVLCMGSVLDMETFCDFLQEEQEFSAQQSALVNRAYSTLLKPYMRGLYLLELNGLTINEKDTLMDAPEFLEGMWALRESIENASSTGDEAVLRKLHITNTENVEKISNEIESHFDSGDYAAAKEGLARMKYFVNIEELLKDTLDLPP